MTKREGSTNLLQQTIKFIGLVMITLYIVAGLALTLDLWKVPRLNRQQALVLGAIMLCYGIFRAWRQYRKFREGEHD